MPKFDPAAIKEILESLDHTVDTNWTEDGAPRMDVIQRAANDTTITRAQVNEAFPGFARKTSDSVTEEVQPDDEPLVEMAKNTTIAPLMVSEEPAEMSPELEHERLRMIAHQRVLDAEAAIVAAKEEVSKALKGVTNAEQRHQRALQVFSAKYPPLTPAENIKLHLRRQLEARRELLGGPRFIPNMAQNPVDTKMMDKKRDNGRNSLKRTA